MRRQLLVIGVALLLVLAGCTGDDGSTGTDTEGGTGTPAATETATVTATPTPDLTDADAWPYPDGAGPEGFSNVSAILQQHRVVFNDSSYHVTFNAERTGSKEGSISFESTAADDRKRVDLSVEETDKRMRIWSDGENTSVRKASNRGVANSYFGPNTSRFADLYRNYDVTMTIQVLKGFLQDFEYEVVDAYDEAGTTYFVYETTGVNESRDDPEYVAGNLTVTLREDGIVTGITGTATGTESGDPYEETLTYSVETDGVDRPAEPDWVDEHVVRVSAELVDEGVIALSHEGGPDVPDAVLFVGSPEFAVTETVDLEAGETVYLAVTENDSGVSLTVSENRPDPGDDAVDIGDTDLSVRVLYENGVAVVGVDPTDEE